MFADIIASIFSIESIWILVFIYVARIVEVSAGTVRIILINKGYRTIGVILAFFEVLIWVFVASRVLNGITEEPIKGIVYSFGYASGVYVGSKIENMLAFGKVLIQAITTDEMGLVIAESLRSQGHGVTSVQGKGKDLQRTVLMIYANRRGNEAIIKKIEAIDPNAMIVCNEVNSLHGGYITGRRRFVK
jgi:uncharacterized protein YebE (UPF0316 family)